MKSVYQFFIGSPVRTVAIALLLMVGPQVTSAQCTFTATPDCEAGLAANNNRTLFTLAWVHNSGPACPTTGDTSYNGNLEASVLGNNTTLTISTNFTVNGDFHMTNSGSSTTLIIPAGVTFHVTGNLGDCTNNNVNFQVDGTLIVDGFVSGKNSNEFSGSGSITAGGLFFNNGVSCPAPCNINWNVGSCEPAGSAFCILPLRLSLFQGEVKANGVHLRWITESESGVDKITLEKSTNGTDFYSLADFPSKGDTQERRTYGFLDEHPMIGKSYYRLRETDLDGQTTHHRIISVEYSGGRLLDLYPVPVTDGMLNLRTNFQTNSESFVRISNVTGMVLVETVFRSGEPLRMPVKLEPGIYLLSFSNGDFRTMKRIVVQ